VFFSSHEASALTPSPQPSLSAVARQKDLGPGSVIGLGACLMQSPARAHQLFGMSARFIGCKPPL